ncbi:MAG TPA: hypothetical protein VMG62_06350 [Solirubrobacteraceae bacterium]|nr:hypothetical protein [Solirubrobacteraceae bacterium]
MQLLKTTNRKTTWWLGAMLGCFALLLATPAIVRAEESNPNNYSCLGSLAAGQPEVGSEEQQVAYSFYCDGPITGYQLQAQVPVTGVSASPVVSENATRNPLTDTFSCSGEIPGYAANCVGSTKGGYETIAGQFSIGTALCREPRVDVLLTVVYAYLEKGVVTQAISGPFDLGRPTGCRPDAQSGGTRLSPKAAPPKHRHRSKKKGKDKGKQGASRKKASSKAGSGSKGHK